ncbi:hypothetical protein [Mycobacteroides chelonae]|uniref:hypothetical protein n=1 Tax=Mycobacteroides chelonae TaxID=1774 RepID=UPI0012FF6FBA|nr:hypothetical protein [Mycobacteroides chelonae]
MTPSDMAESATGLHCSWELASHQMITNSQNAIKAEASDDHQLAAGQTAAAQ